MAKKQDVKSVGKFEELLSCKLTDGELLERGAKLAQVNGDIRDHLEHAKSVKEDLKAKQTALESERSRLAGIVRTKHEPRSTSVERFHDFSRRMAFNVRTDTNEVIAGSERALLPDEMQEELPGFPKGGKPKPVLADTPITTVGEEAAAKKAAKEKKAVEAHKGSTAPKPVRLVGRKLDEKHLAQDGEE